MSYASEGLNQPPLDLEPGKATSLAFTATGRAVWLSTLIKAQELTKQYRPALEQISKEIAALQEERDRIICVVQSACGHPNREVFEWTRDSQPPYAVCALCGYSEEGWGSGYWRLPGDRLGQIDASRWRELRLGITVSQSAMGEPDHDRYGHHKAKTCKENCPCRTKPT